MSEKETVKDFIANGDIAGALKTLLSMDLPSKDRSKVIQIKASFEKLRKDARKGIVGFEQQTTEQNKINDRLLQFLDGETSDAEPAPLPSHRRKWWEYVVGAGVLIGILGGMAEWSGYSLKDLFGGGNGAADTFSVTVFVHGKQGRDERILKNQGQVMLSLRSNEMPCSINEKGEATFKEIPMGFKGQKFNPPASPALTCGRQALGAKTTCAPA